METILRYLTRRYVSLLQKLLDLKIFPLMVILGMDGVFQLFVPADRSIPKIRIETRQAEFLRTQKLIVTIDSWPRHSRYPHVCVC